MTMDPSTLWLIAGIVLIIGEMLTGGFFLLFLALGAFAGALAASLGGTIFLQGSACALVSVIGVLGLRKPIQKKLLKSISVHADMGKEIVLDQALPPHQQTRVPYQGTQWTAINVGSELLKEGSRAVIVGVDGNILLIRKSH